MAHSRRILAEPDPWGGDELDDVENLLAELDDCKQTFKKNEAFPSSSLIYGKSKDSSSIVYEHRKLSNEAPAVADVLRHNHGVDNTSGNEAMSSTDAFYTGGRDHAKGKRKASKTKQLMSFKHVLSDEDLDFSPPLDILYDVPAVNDIWSNDARSKQHTIPVPLVASAQPYSASERHLSSLANVSLKDGGSALTAASEQEGSNYIEDSAKSTAGNNATKIDNTQGVVDSLSKQQTTKNLTGEGWNRNLVNGYTITDSEIDHRGLGPNSDKELDTENNIAARGGWLRKSTNDAINLSPTDDKALEESILDIPVLEQEVDLTHYPSIDHSHISGSVVVNSSRTWWPCRNGGSKLIRQKPSLAEHQNVKYDAIKMKIEAKQKKAQENYEAQRAKVEAKKAAVKFQVDKQKETAIGGLLADVIGNINPLAKKQSKGVFERATKFIQDGGGGNVRYNNVKASFDAETQRENDIETVMLFAAASDDSFDDNLKKSDVMKALLRRKAWKWKPFTMFGVLAMQIMISLAALVTYDNPINIPVAALIILFVVAAAASNKYSNTKSAKILFDKMRERVFQDYGMLFSFYLLFLASPILCLVFIFNFLFDLLVGRLKDFSYGAMSKHLVGSIVTCTALSIGVRAASPLDVVQTFAGFAFIAQLDEAVFCNMSFDPYSDYFPTKEKDARTKKRVVLSVLSVLVPAYAIVALIAAVAEYFCVFCTLGGVTDRLIYSK